MKPSERRVCVRCGHSWNASGRVPGRCAKCGTYKWNEAPTRFDCSKCGHEWTAQGKKPPNKCPKCRSTLWNDASGNAGNGDSREAYDSDTRNIYLDMVERPRLEEILLKYRRGSSCTSIAISTGVSFSIVYGIINDEYPMSSIRV
jgi:predicted Zn-ribbon and HTH transcriptional regulator